MDKKTNNKKQVKSFKVPKAQPKFKIGDHVYSTKGCRENQAVGLIASGKIKAFTLYNGFDAAVVVKDTYRTPQGKTRVFLLDNLQLMTPAIKRKVKLQPTILD